MTEEIIVDGVNVAGCDAYLDEHCKDKTAIMFCETNFCKKFPNCHYKQLKRLEQERDELKQENERLKKSFVSHTEFMDLLENNPNINWETTAKENIYLINKYKSALEEIRAYSENFCEKTCRFYANKDSMACNEYCLLDNIVTPVLEKINEVLGC